MGNTKLVLAGAAGIIGTVMLALGGCETQRPLHIVRQSAEYNYSVENFDKALTDYQEYVQRKPNDPDVLYGLGRTYLKLDRGVDAKSAMYTAHDIRPGNPDYADGVADALMAANDRTALTTFLNQQTTERGGMRDYLRLGRYMARIGHADEAQTALRTAAKLDAGRTIEPQLALADFYKSIGDRPAETTRLRYAMWIEPNNLKIQARLRDLGQIVGPSLALRPEEWQEAPAPGNAPQAPLPALAPGKN